MPRGLKALEQKPSHFPPAVKGWWEYRRGEPGVEYVPIVKKTAGFLQGWDFLKIQEKETEPISGLFVLLQHGDMSMRSSGVLELRQDGSMQLFDWHSGEVILHFTRVECREVKVYPLLGVVKLPKVGRAFVEERYNDSFHVDDAYLKEREAFYNKYLE